MDVPFPPAINFQHMKKMFLIFFLVTDISYALQSSMTVYPLVNQSHDALHEWVACCIPEYFSRKLSALEGIRVWDPIFMFQTDSLGWKMTNDSLLLVHASRWMWNAAIGGKYTVRNDSVYIDLKIMWVTGIQQHVTMKIAKAVKMADIFKSCGDLLLTTCTLLKITLSKKDSLWILADDHAAVAAQRTFDAGYGLEMNGLYSEAQTAYHQAIHLDPSFVLARCRSGAIYVRTGNMSEAEKVFKNLINSKDHTAVTMAMTAEFAVDQYKPSQSSRIIEKFRGNLEKSASGLATIGKWYLTIGEYQRATALLQRAIAWGAMDLNAEFLLAMTYMSSGEYNAAIEIFNRLITIRPDYIRYQVSLGAVYRKAGRHMESLAVLETARKKEPENALVLIELAHTCFALTWYRKAGQLLEQARTLKPDQIEILIDLGIVYWHEKRFADANRCFSLAESEDKEKQTLEVNYGNMQLMGGNIGKAVAAYKAAGRSGNRNPEILYNLAIAYLKMGNKKKSAACLDELLQLTPGRTDLLVLHAHLAQLLGKNEDAEMAYLQILENDAYNDPAMEGLVKLLIVQKKYQEAIYRIESYLEAKPARGDFMVMLGDVYLAQGWYEVAIVKYEQVVHTFADYPAGYLGIGRCRYEMIRHKNNKEYDIALFALKQAGGKAPTNPEPDDMMGDIYMYYKGERDLAIAHWRTALTKTQDPKQKKNIMGKIAAAGKSTVTDGSR
jgi:tetratricopeptide (TPR) repeat protein